jgi:hypothetical protein
MRAKALLALAGVSSSMLAVASIAWASAGVTKVTLRAPTTKVNAVHGRLFSRKTACVGGRTIIVFRQKGTTPDPAKAQMMATTTSKKHGTYGSWSITTALHHGSYFAEATKTSQCRAGLSATVTVR